MHKLLAIQHAQICASLNLTKIPVVEIHEAPSLAEELFVVDKCSKIESQFSLRVFSQVNLFWASDWPHIQEYMGSTNWTQ